MSFLDILFGKSNVNNIRVGEWDSLPRDVIILDVRTPDEYRQSHIPKARNLNLYDSRFFERVNKLKKNKHILVYCRTGIRSMVAARKMDKIGYKNVYNLRGGFVSWVRNKG